MKSSNEKIIHNLNKLNRTIACKTNSGGGDTSLLAKENTLKDIKDILEDEIAPTSLNIFTLENQTSNQNYNAISITFVKMEEGTGTVILDGEDITDMVNVLGSFTFNDNTPSSSPISIEVSGIYKALVSVRA